MKRLALGLAIVLAAMTPAGAQTADRLHVMDCGHNSAKDQSLWSPGINVGKPIEQANTCTLIKHGSQWLLWDTGYPDASPSSRSTRRWATPRVQRRSPPSLPS